MMMMMMLCVTEPCSIDITEENVKIKIKIEILFFFSMFDLKSWDGKWKWGFEM